MNQNNLTKQLQAIINDKPKSIQAFVAQEALETECIRTFFHDLSQYGCVSGMITSLIYYQDTHKFLDEYYDEIEELRDYLEDNLGETIKVNGDLKNFLAWFAFEETAFQLSKVLIP